MSEPISSLKPQPPFFSSANDPPTPLKEKPKSINLDYVPTAPAAKFTPVTTPASTVDVSKWPTPLLERNVDALTKQLAANPNSVTGADRARLDAMEKTLSARYAAETPPALGPVAKKEPRVELCKRPADLPGNDYVGLEHHWIRTSHVEAGMGPESGGVPGHKDGNNGKLFGKTTINDHSGEGDLIDAHCDELPNVSEACIEKKLKLGTPTGRWAPVINDCHSVTARLIDDCKTGAP